MLRLRPHSLVVGPVGSVGQYTAPTTSPYLQSYAQPQQQSNLDPLVRLGLNTAGQVLAKNDPGAPETMSLIQQIIEAPGWGFLEPQPTAPAKISDLNPLLKTALVIRVHPLAVLLGVLAVPALAFMLGRRTAS